MRPLCGLITLSSMKRKPRVSVAFEGRESAEQSIRIYIIVSKFICIINVYHRCLCCNSYKLKDMTKEKVIINIIILSGAYDR